MQARSITHADPQATPGGRHIAALLKQWDITETPQRRIAPKSAISGGAELIANGEVDIGLYLLSEVLTVKGVAVAGMLPPAPAELHRLCRRGAGRQPGSGGRGGVHPIRRRPVAGAAMEDDGIRERQPG